MVSRRTVHCSQTFNMTFPYGQLSGHCQHTAFLKHRNTAFLYGWLSGHTVHCSQTPQHHISVWSAFRSHGALFSNTATQRFRMDGCQVTANTQASHTDIFGEVTQPKRRSGVHGIARSRLKQQDLAGRGWKSSAVRLCTARIVGSWLYFFHELWRNLFLFTCPSFLIFHKIGIYFKNCLYGLFCLHVWQCTYACLVPAEVRGPGTGATDSCKTPYDWELNQGPLKYQKVLFITEPFFSPCEAVTLWNYFKQIIY